jgi:serine-type D-Ala-D-Ala carboxypeptidase
VIPIDSHRVARTAAVLTCMCLATGCAARSPMALSGDREMRDAVHDAVHLVLVRALADSAFPGAYAVVGSRSGILAKVSVGHLDWHPSPAPDEDTIWDLASLTKVVGMTTAVMQLWERGKLELDAWLGRYLSGFGGPHKEKVTLRRLLSHSAGLPAWRPLHLEATSAAAALQLVYAAPLDTVPGSRVLYSDLGAILVGEVIRQVSGEALSEYLTRQVFRPLGMNSTMFRPDTSLLPRIAPTEFDPWRGRHLRGEVHDENAHFLGGVAAHAGLFSTARDLTMFAQMLLSGGSYRGRRIVDRNTIATFTSPQDPALGSRALGWELADGRNSAGQRLSARAFGHTGFTGTSLWIDPARDLFVLLLTNRVNPSRENRRITLVRAALCDAVASAIDASYASAPLHTARTLP